MKIKRGSGETVDAPVRTGKRYGVNSRLRPSKRSSKFQKAQKVTNEIKRGAEAK